MKVQSFLTIVAGIALSTSLFAQDPKPTANVPTYKVGDEWRYQQEIKSDQGKLSEWVEKVDRVSDNEAWILRTTANGTRSWRLIDAPTGTLKTEYKFDGNSAHQLGAANREHLPVAAVVQFPLELGKSYPVKQKWVNAQGHNGTSDLKAKVTASEIFKESGEEIDSFRVDLSGWWNNHNGGSSGRIEITLWYAPSMKQIVKWEHKDYFNNQLNAHSITRVVAFKAAQ